MKRLAIYVVPLVAVGILAVGVTAQQKPKLKFSRPTIRVTGKVSNQDILMTASSRMTGSKSAANDETPAAAKTDGDTFLVLNMEFDTEAHCSGYAAKLAPSFTRSGKYLEAFLPATKAKEGAAEIDTFPGLVRLEVVTRTTIPPPAPTGGEAKRFSPEPIVRGGLAGMTGKGVIVAIIDSGIDFRNKDFIRMENGKPVSRILYLWDTTSNDYSAGKGGVKPPISFPNGAGVGTIYSKSQLTADLQQSTSAIGPRDLNGHGTSCAGIAAGNGTNKADYIGVAPDADIIAVRIGSSDASGLENAWTMNAACDWLDRYAGPKPIVISCSFGGQDGRHDGSSIEELELANRFPDSARGRAICVAAGNEGAQAIHAEVKLGTEAAPATISWKATPGSSLSLHFDTDELADIKFTPGPGLKLPKLTAKYYPETKQATVPINTLGDGTGSLSLYSDKGRTIKCDVYIYGGTFDAGCATFSKLIGRPGTSSAVITVGSYDWCDTFEIAGQLMTVTPKSGALVRGGLSNYSSLGPSRNPKDVKPDLVAPGQYYAASAPLNATHGKRDTTGLYQLFNGTSAATPYVSGCIALIMQKKPDITFGDIKSAIHGGLTKDTYTGDLPNYKWGFGKLDLSAMKSILSSIK
ncbi:MAG: S8 family serine peptidase [Chthonomonadales bacterium]